MQNTTVNTAETNLLMQTLQPSTVKIVKLYLFSCIGCCSLHQIIRQLPTLSFKQKLSLENET